jgi:hypothetical protein
VVDKLQNEKAAILEVLREEIRRPGGTGWVSEDKILSGIAPAMGRGIFEFAVNELEGEGLIDQKRDFDGYIAYQVYRVTRAGL